MIISYREAFIGKRQIKDYSSPDSGWMLASEVDKYGFNDDFMAVKKGPSDGSYYHSELYAMIYGYNKKEITYKINAGGDFGGHEGGEYWYYPEKDMMLYITGGEREGIGEEGLQEVMADIVNSNFSIGTHIIARP